MLLESYSSGKEVGKACSRLVVHNQVHRAIRRNKYEGVIAKGFNKQGDFNRMVNNLNALGVLHASIAFAEKSFASHVFFFFFFITTFFLPSDKQFVGCD